MHVPATQSHDGHDPILIAGLASGDITDAQANAAATLVAECGACGDLHRDLVAITAATRGLPSHLPAPRDFRLTAEQAEGLRRDSWLRRLLRPFGSARSAARPLATAFTSVGLAGLLVAAFVPGLLGGAASAPAQEFTGAGAPAATAPPLVPQAGGPGVAGPSEPGTKAEAGDSGRDVAIDGGAGGASGQEGSDTVDNDRLGAIGTPANLLAVGSLGLLLAGLAMFGLRFAARRLR